MRQQFVGVSSNSIDLVEMFTTANSFFNSAIYCSKAENSFYKGFDTPVIVNLAFACEIYIKMLLIFENNKTMRSHDLFELFQKLSDDKQKNINNRMLQLGYKQNNGMEMNELYCLAKSFEQWRYRYEYSILNCNMGYLTTFATVLRDQCSEDIFNSMPDVIEVK